MRSIQSLPSLFVPSANTLSPAPVRLLDDHFPGACVSRATMIHIYPLIPELLGCSQLRRT